MQIGYKLASEAFGPNEIIRQAVRAERAGFDFVEMSDHYHPWLDNQGHSSFTWTVLGAIAARTERIGLVTGVTCPTVRYHPAIIAQAAATLALVSGDRFTLGLGAGERLNEHVVGRGFPAVRIRHEMFREALEIIRLLWEGGYRSYEGKHLQLEDARCSTCPSACPRFAVAAGGPAGLGLRCRVGGQGGAVHQPVGPHGVEGHERTAQPRQLRRRHHHRPRGGHDRAVRVRPRPGPVVKQFTDAGFDRIVLMNAGPDPDGFFAFFESTLAERVRALAPG